MSDKKHLLDLVPNKRIRSEDTFDFKGRQVRWQLLDGEENISCRHAGQKRTLDLMVDELGLEREAAYRLMQAGSSADTEQEWYEYYTLAAAMTDAEGEPLSMDSIDDIALRLSKLCPPIERRALMVEYIQFAEEHDPTNLSDEQIEEIIAAVGKDAQILRQLGSNSLRNLLAIMVPRLIHAEFLLEEMQETESLESRIQALEHAILQTDKFKDGSD